jgi:hypothetical protein
MSIKRTMLFATTLAVVAGASSVATPTGQAATPECGERCISVFSHALGTYAEPNFVEGVLHGAAKVGQPVIVSEASGSNPSQDLLPRLRPVSVFHAAGMVSDDVKDRYSDHLAVQIEYAPSGNGTELCVGLKKAAYQNEGLTLQPCDVPGTTVWVIDTLNFDPEDGIFALVNASSRNLVRPFAMSFPHSADPSDELNAQITVRRLQFLGRDRSPTLRQLWGALNGPLTVS